MHIHMPIGITFIWFIEASIRYQYTKFLVIFAAVPLPVLQICYYSFLSIFVSSIDSVLCS